MTENIILVFAASAGALLTYILHTKFLLGAVRSSALVALSAALILKLFPDLLSNYLTTHIPIIVIGASFVGMATNERLGTYLSVGIAGAIFGCIYLNTGKYFDGYGGTLGTSACIAVLVTMSMHYLHSKRKLTYGVLKLRRRLLKRDLRRKNIRP